MSEVLRKWFSEDSVTNESTLIHDYLTDTITVQSATESLAQTDLSVSLDTVIGDIASQFPETHDPLVVLLGTLKHQNEKTDFAGCLVYVLDERWLRYADPDRSSIQQDIRNEWTNLNHFAALTHKANVQDLSRFAVTTLDMAWRQNGWNVMWETSGTSDSLKALEGQAPAAAQWIAVCGERLYKECSTAREKWGQWEANLDWIVRQDGLYDSTRVLCQKALDEMRKVALSES